MVPLPCPVKMECRKCGTSDPVVYLAPVVIVADRRGTCICLPCARAGGWLMKRHGFVPRRIVTDKLRSYGAARREIAPGLGHWSHKGLNNRAENSHLPFRKRERGMQGFRSPAGLQRFVSVHSAVRNAFLVPTSRRAALTICCHRLQAFDTWKAAANIA